jgi:hypothetical protein
MTQPMSKERAVEVLQRKAKEARETAEVLAMDGDDSWRSCVEEAELYDLALSALRQGEGEAVAWMVGQSVFSSEAEAIEEIVQWGPSGAIAIPLYAHPPAQAATQPERPQGGDAWDCPLCGQRNSGWSNECGRCEMKRLATPQPAHAVGEAQISTAPAIRAASKFLIDRFGKARCDSEAVSCCVRCNAVALARMSVELLTPPLPVERKEGERG